MKKIAVLGISILCLASFVAKAQMSQPPMDAPPYQGMPQQGYMQPQQGYLPPPPPMVAAQPYCQPYTDTFKMGAEKRVTHGTACLHPDGSWELHPTQASLNYMNRGGNVFIVPSEPFATVVVGDGHPHHHHDW